MTIASRPVEQMSTEDQQPVGGMGLRLSLAVVVLSTDRVGHWLSSPGSVQSEGSFHSTMNSPTDRAPAIQQDPKPIRPSYGEGPFVPANPHPRIGDDSGVVRTVVQHIGRLTLRISTKISAPESTRLLDRSSREWVKSLSGVRPSTPHADFTLCLSNEVEPQHIGPICAKPSGDGFQGVGINSGTI